MDVLVVGAGVVGLACARALALRGHAVIVAEKTAGIGNGVSSRNSEVIHGGMYYPTNSVRARHCVAGRRMLYDYCESHGVPHKKCGKLIVATNDLERAKIEGIHQQGLANDVEGLALVGGNELRAMEPELSAIAAVHSPETGIVDSHAFMLALQGDLEDAGGVIAFNTTIERLTRAGRGWEVHFGGAEAGEMPLDAVVNSASLGAQALALATEGYPPERVPKLVLAKGNYFGCLGRPAFSHLIYPAPVEGGLGTHLPSILPDACASARTSSGSRRRRTRSTRTGRRCSTPRSGAGGRGCPTGRSPPTIRESARSSPVRASPRPISSSTARPSTASRASSTSSASNRRG